MTSNPKRSTKETKLLDGAYASMVPPVDSTISLTSSRSSGIADMISFASVSRRRRYASVRPFSNWFIRCTVSTYSRVKMSGFREPSTYMVTSGGIFTCTEGAVCESLIRF